MTSIATLYTSLDELLLDIDVLGTILTNTVTDSQQLKEYYYEEYKHNVPLVIGEERYGLSSIVSADYHIQYNQELQLQTDEELLDFDYVDNESDIQEDAEDIDSDFGFETVIEEDEDELEVLSEESKRSVVDTFGTASDIDVSSDTAYDYLEENLVDSTEDVEEEKPQQGIAEGDMFDVDSMFDVSDEPDFVDTIDETAIKSVKVSNIEGTSDTNIVVPVAPILKQDKSVERKQEDNKEIKDVPTDLREFLRKYPHSEIDFVLKYFTKKQVQTALMTGKVIKKGNKLHI